MGNVRFRRECAAAERLPWGPYWLEDQNLRKGSRLYPDEIDAFVMLTVPHGKNHFEYRPLGVAVHGELNPASYLPLAGLRIAVKDNTGL